jgi:hypothetical protein
VFKVLSDIELAQSMQENAEKEEAKKESEKQPSPTDINYDLLKAKLELVDQNSEEFKVKLVI